MSSKALVQGPVLEHQGEKYHLHPNGGGFIAETAQVHESVFVGFCSMIMPGVIIRQGSIIYPRSIVRSGTNIGRNVTIGVGLDVPSICAIEDNIKIDGPHAGDILEYLRKHSVLTSERLQDILRPYLSQPAQSEILFPKRGRKKKRAKRRKSPRSS